jgi:thiamine biosynthesis lipoprotein
VLGTVCTITLYDAQDQETCDLAFARIRQIEDRMSANKDSTEIAAINKAAGVSPVKVSPDVFEVVRRALYFAELSDGAFDPSIGPLVKLWDIGFDGAKVPPADRVKQALSLTGRKDVVLDAEKSTIYLRRALMRLDLGAIAKGYAGDEARRILVSRGVSSAVVDLGGNIVVVGRKRDGKPWKVGVQNPFDRRGDYFGILSLDASRAIVTSGIYERFFEEDGKRYHHILNTQSGFPVDNGLVSVTIISPSSLDADGLSTTVFALGKDAGMEFLSRFPDCYALFIDKEHRVFLSPGASAVFTLVDKAFTIRD